MADPANIQMNLEAARERARLERALREEAQRDYAARWGRAPGDPRRRAIPLGVPPPNDDWHFVRDPPGGRQL